MKKILYFSILTILIFSCYFTRFHNLGSFYTEIDDQISISQMMRYKRLDLYAIANDIESKTYNSKIKFEIRKLQNLDNKFINFSQKIISKIYANTSPSKHSTLAPLQYFLFGWMVDIDQNYNKLKFNSRFPSAVFSILTVYITFLLSKKLFSNKNLFYLIPPTILTISLPLIYISQRSYNYSAGTFALVFLCLFFIKQNDKTNKFFFKYDQNKILIKKNFIISMPLLLLPYLNYILLYLTPIYFLLNFIYSSRKNNKVFNTENNNLIITGLIYSAFILPILFHIYNQNLLDNGMSGSTAGEFFEYSIDTYKTGGILSIIKFYLKNIYLIITENLSFFLNDFFLSKYLKIFLFLCVFWGFFISFFTNKTKEQSLFFFFSCCCFLTWIIMSYFNILALGPTRHLQIFTPFFSIIFSFGIYKLTHEKYSDKITVLLIIIFFSIFVFNYKNFTKVYKDLANENKILSLIEKYNVGYIANWHSTIEQDLANSFGFGRSYFLCNINSIKVRIQACTLRNYRYVSHEKLDKKMLKNLKKNSLSIAFYNKKIDEKISLYLKEIGFVLTYSFEEIRFISNSPLLISKYEPNFLSIKIFK